MLQGAAQRGARFHFIFAVLRALFSCSQMSLFHLKILHSREGSPLKHHLKNSIHRRAILWRTSQKFVGGSGRNFQRLALNSSGVAFVCRIPKASQKLLQKSALQCIRLFSVLVTTAFALENKEAAFDTYPKASWIPFLLFSYFFGAPQNLGMSWAFSYLIPVKSLPSRSFGGPPPLHVEDPHPTRRCLDPKVCHWAPFSCLTSRRMASMIMLAPKPVLEEHAGEAAKSRGQLWKDKFGMLRDPCDLGPS